MANSIRVEKVTSEITRALSDILRNEVSDQRIHDHFGSITRVEVTRDLQHAKVFLSVFGSAEEQAAFMDGIFSAQGFIRGELGKRIRLRFVPELHFKFDKSFEEGSKILALLDDMKSKGEI